MHAHRRDNQSSSSIGGADGFCFGAQHHCRIEVRQRNTGEDSAVIQAECRGNRISVGPTPIGLIECCSYQLLIHRHRAIFAAAVGSLTGHPQLVEPLTDRQRQSNRNSACIRTMTKLVDQADNRRQDSVFLLDQLLHVV